MEWRRVRQVRRIDLRFLLHGYYPPFWPETTNSCARIPRGPLKGPVCGCFFALLEGLSRVRQSGHLGQKPGRGIGGRMTVNLGPEGWQASPEISGRLGVEYAAVGASFQNGSS